MYRIYGAMISIISSIVFTVPILTIYNKFYIHNVRRTLLYVIFELYLIAMLSLVGFPTITELTVDVTVNAIPFVDIIDDFTNACLNVLLFIPFGIFLPLLWDKYKKPRNEILATICTILIIEFSQLFTYRTSDINDVFTNMLGSIIGYITIKLITSNFSRYTKSYKENRDFYILCLIAVIVMFFFEPYISSIIWNMIL